MITFFTLLYISIFLDESEHGFANHLKSCQVSKNLSEFAKTGQNLLKVNNENRRKIFTDVGLLFLLLIVNRYLLGVIIMGSG